MSAEVLHRVLGYMADIVGTDRERAPTIDGVVFSPKLQFQSWPMDATRDRRLRKLAAADGLQAAEHLTYEGRYWIRGVVGGKRYQWPMVRRRASITRGAPVRPVPKGPWELTPGVVDRAVLDALAADEGAIWAKDIPIESAPELPLERYPKLYEFVTGYLAGLGLEPIAISTTTAPGEARGLRVEAVSGVYLERQPFELNRWSAIKLWQGRDLSGTALDALYCDVDTVTETDSDRPVLSPLPLNATQRSVLERSRTEALAVVSGPPGTGKSHLVAAAAIDHVAAGKSVLVASQSVHACDVIADLLARYPMVEALRFGDDTTARSLGDQLAAGVPSTDESFHPRVLRDVCTQLADEAAVHRERLRRRINDLAGFERALVRRHDVPLWLASRDLAAIDLRAVEVAAEQLGADGMLGWWHRRRGRARLTRQLGRAALEPDELRTVIESVEADQLVESVAGRDLGLDELWDELDRIEERWRRKIGDYLEALRRDRAGSRHRSSLQALASALRKGAVQRRTELAEIGTDFLEVVPLWIGTLSEIEAVLPAQAGLFDLVILDEASQIAQASAVPALARAKQAIVVGDSRQLRHVSFVSSQHQADAAARNGLSDTLASRLDDRANSLFDAATAVAPVIELDEHYRSVPHVIGFSDCEFYGGRLRLMTQHPVSEAADAIEVVTVDGERGPDRVVEAEVNETVRQVRLLVTAGATSIGVVSPFRSQADAIEEALVEAFTLDEIDRHQIRVGTVHGFQGTERDHLIISVGVGPGDRRALTFVEDPAIFNVMVTRARSHVVVVTTLDRASAGRGLLGRYLRHAEEPPALRDATIDASGWTERLARELAEHGKQRVITGYRVAGERIDVVVGSGSWAIGIETEIHPDGADRHIERRLALKRAGWDLRSFHRATVYGREEEAIAQLLARFSRG